MRQAFRVCVAVGIAMVVSGWMATAASADAVPLKEMKAKAKGTTPLGDWSLMAYSGRNDFPFLSNAKELEEVEAGRWVLPVRGAGEVSINDKAINVRSAGMINNDEQDKWLAAVVFAPKEVGDYTVSGKLTGLWCDLDHTGKENLKWAVLLSKSDGKKFKAIASGMAGEGDSVDLSTFEKLKSVKLEAGESLVITVFRPAHWGAAGGNITDLAVEKASGK